MVWNKVWNKVLQRFQNKRIWLVRIQSGEKLTRINNEKKEDGIVSHKACVYLVLRYWRNENRISLLTRPQE